MSKKRAIDPLKRLPRYPTANDIGGLARKIWKRPKFRVGLPSNTTEFIFSLGFSIPKKVKNHHLAFHSLLFDPKRSAWSRALNRSYKEARQGSQRVRDVSERMLFKVFAQALAILFEEARLSEGPYKGFIEGDAQAVLETAKRRRRPPDRARKTCAKRMAERYDSLLPEVKALLKFITCPAQRVKNTNVAQVVGEQFSQEWVKHVTEGIALQNLPLIAGHDNRTECLMELKCTARQLTVGIIFAEERQRNPKFDLQPNTILEEYLPLGRRLNEHSR